MATSRIPLAKQIDRVPSTPVPLDASQELRFRNLMEELVMVDIHQHPMVAPVGASHRSMPHAGRASRGLSRSFRESLCGLRPRRAKLPGA